jgi:hypothetical protein
MLRASLFKCVHKLGGQQQTFKTIVLPTYLKHFHTSARFLQEHSNVPPNNINPEQKPTEKAPKYTIVEDGQEKSSMTTAYEWFKKVSGFYWEGTKQMYRNVQQARKLRRDIAFRLFRRADRRETMFLHQVTIDLVKFVPAGTMFMLPGGTILLPLLAFLAPNLMPSVYQSPEYLNRSRKQHYEIRKENSTKVIDTFMRLTTEILADPSQSHHHTEAKFLQNLINKVRDARIYDTGTKNFILVSTETLNTLQELDKEDGLFHTLFAFAKSNSRIDSDLLKDMTLFLLVSKHEAYGVSGVGSHQVKSALSGSGSGGIHLPIFKYMIMAWAETNFAFNWVRQKGLRDYLEQIRNDDIYIHYFSIHNMTREEIMQALYMRGLNVHEQGQMKKFSLSELQELMTAWIQFSTKTKSESLIVFAQTMLWWP